MPSAMWALQEEEHCTPGLQLQEAEPSLRSWHCLGDKRLPPPELAQMLARLGCAASTPLRNTQACM